MLDLIIFDKDGTLLELDELWNQPSVDAVNNLLMMTDWSPAEKETYKRSLGIVNDQLQMNALFSAGSIQDQGRELAQVLPWSSERIADYLEEAYLDFVHTQGASQVQAVPGAHELLEGLASDYRLALVTNDNASLTQATLKQAGLWEYFDYVASSDDHVQKPDPATLDLLAQRYQTTRQRMIYVGDSALDMVYGSHTRCAVGYASSPAAYEHLGQADVIIDHLLDLFSVIDQLNQEA